MKHGKRNNALSVIHCYVTKRPGNGAQRKEEKSHGKMILFIVGRVGCGISCSHVVCISVCIDVRRKKNGKDSFLRHGTSFFPEVPILVSTRDEIEMDDVKGGHVSPDINSSPGKSDICIHIHMKSLSHKKGQS